MTSLRQSYLYFKALAVTFVILLSVSRVSAAALPIEEKANPFFGSTYFVPEDLHSRTAIILLHGSEGGSAGYINNEARELASEGYAVLVFCYFDCNRGTGIRQTLKDVEVERVLDAVAWLRGQASNNGKVVIYGFSRGGELAMILGSLETTTQNKPTALIAHSPSDIFNSTFNEAWYDPACWICIAGEGQCDDQSPHSAYDWNPACGPDNPRTMDPNQSAWKISGVTVPSHTRIEIEKFRAPVLLTVGLADEIWPVDQTRRLESTLRSHACSVDAHYFPGAGHVFHGVDEQTRRELVLRFLRGI